ncbi:MAG: hypothetical protein V3U20_10880, partial [Thermoplasmata archaeon]
SCYARMSLSLKHEGAQCPKLRGFVGMFSNFRHTAWFQGLAKRGVSVVEARDGGTAQKRGLG